jgi:hypothetical protein
VVAIAAQGLSEGGEPIPDTQDPRSLVVLSTIAEHALFRFVVSADEGARLLPTDQLAAVLSAPNRADLFIGAAVASSDAAVILRV